MRGVVACALLWALLGVVACLPEVGDLCRLGTTACDGSCVELDRDPDHCGACGQACEAGTSCVDGSCAPPCGMLAACEGSCADLATDPRHCGACDRACPSGAPCVDGACAESCGGEARLCEGSCRDTTSDEAHCGGCGVVCGSGATCRDGECACPDVLSDAANCGVCGQACLADQRCVAGGCRPHCRGAVCLPGEVVWGRRIGEDGTVDPASSYDQTAYAVDVSPSGEVALAAEVRGSIFVGPQSENLGTGIGVMIARFDAVGRLLGTTMLAGPGRERVRDLAWAPDGDLFVVGRHNATGGTFCNLPAATDEEDGYVVRIGPDGTCRWGVAVAGTNNQFLEALALDDDGSLLVAGFSEAQATVVPAIGNSELVDYQTGRDVVVLRLAPETGALLDSAGLTGDGNQTAVGITRLANGGVAVVGSYDAAWTVAGDGLAESAADQPALYVAALDETLLPRWGRGYRVTSASSSHIAEGFSVAATAGGMVVLGEARGEIEIDGDTVQTNLASRDLWLAELDLDGQLRWWRFLGGAGQEDAGQAVVDERGDVLVVGTFQQTMNLGASDEAGGVLEAGPGGDLFIAAFTPPTDASAPPSASYNRDVGGDGLKRPRRIALGTGTVAVAGDFRDGIDWGHGPVWSPPGLNQGNPVGRFDALVLSMAR
ncbi:MAG: hypothetical protein KC731_23465 [Myxococcales bacterium]|nr:hypothetical protein [Myxococcales bacterium]